MHCWKNVLLLVHGASFVLLARWGEYPQAIVWRYFHPHIVGVLTAWQMQTPSGYCQACVCVCVCVCVLEGGGGGSVWTRGGKLQHPGLVISQLTVPDYHLALQGACVIQVLCDLSIQSEQLLKVSCGVTNTLSLGLEFGHRRGPESETGDRGGGGGGGGSWLNYTR